MDQYEIKSVVFGGFDKQDVVQYIEKAAREAEETRTRLLSEQDGLREQLEGAKREAEALREQLAELNREKEALADALARETALRQELEALRPLTEEVERLRSEAEDLRPDAGAYRQFRDRIGSIECEARTRAAEMENDTAARLRQAVELFREQYRTLMSTFETAASHVNKELRKVEVNLTQLPLAMDRTGKELNALAEQLEQKEDGRT